MDKILKTLETIKVPTLSGSDANIPGTIISAVVAASDSVKTKKKERISHCRSVTDAICLGSVQGIQDYAKILESVVEVLFQLSSDDDSDIRLVAVECLNRLVRTLKESQQPKLHMEIYKEIRRNQNAKSLRTALSIFAHISSSIKPQKCRAFFASLLPCFVQISKRTEEYLYENLGSYFAEIFKNLGAFAQDQEVKLLCKEYLTNLQSSSAIIRRASASILVSVCQYSKKPHIFLPKLMNHVSSLLMPKLMEKSVATLIGSLQCIRHVIAPLYEVISNPTRVGSSPIGLETSNSNIVLQLVQVYEMCVILCNHDDHNVVTTSLETLQQLLTDPIEPLRVALTSKNGIENSIDNNSALALTSEQLNLQSVSTNLSTSLEADLDSLNLPDGYPELLASDNDIPKFRSFLSSTASESRDTETESDVNEAIFLSCRNSEIGLDENPSAAAAEVEIDMDSSSQSELLHQSNEDLFLSPGREVLLPIQNFPEIQIGSLYEKNVPVYYCARFLAYNFLLAGQKGYQRSDSEIRISVKVLAINCLVNLVKIAPEVFFLPLSHGLEVEGDDEAQKIEDVCLYSTHNDPLLRGCTYVLVGFVVERNLEEPEVLSKLTAILKGGLLDSSNIGVKCAIAAVSTCLGKLWRTNGLSFAEDLFGTCLIVASNPYWLVKVDLVELLSRERNIACSSVPRRHQVCTILLEYLCDEDVRVRNAAVTFLPKFINTTAADAWSPESHGVLCPQCIVQNGRITCDLAYQPLEECKMCGETDRNAAGRLEDIIHKLITTSVTSSNKNTFAGYQAALAHLSETHPPFRFQTAWHLKNRISDCGSTLGLYMDLLRSSPFIYDLNVHQSVIKIAGNLFLASNFYDRATAKSKSFEEGNPFLSNNSKVCVYGTQFLQHVIAVLKLYKNIIEQCLSSSSSSSTRKVSTSPVISPVKKFSQKLEAEKKASESEIDKKAKGPYFATILCPIHMRKVNESIMQAWRVYRCSLDSSATVKFTSLLTSCLESLGRIFSVVRSDYPAMGSLIEDILSVTQSIFSFCPSDSLKCIRKILQSIFAGYDLDNTPEILQIPSDVGWDRRGRFPLLLFPNQLFRFPVDEKPAGGSVSRSSSEVTALGQFIRQFEPAVVAGLRVYTTTSNTSVQVEVLRLLKQLINGHVNYGLVDSNLVFLGFVVKQITYLEEGQIRNPSLLIEEMFQFLSLLSHEHHATKSFIDFPKILGLCDILVSSEFGSQNGIKCLMPAVLDIILKQFKPDHTNWERKESSSHAETLLELMMKVARYPDVLPVIWVLLSGRQQRQESKWNEDSSKILETLLRSIEENVLKIKTGFSFNCLLATLCSLHKDSIQPPEELVASLESLLEEDVTSFSRYSSWICAVSCYWTLIVRSFINTDRNPSLEGVSGTLVMKVLLKMSESFKLTWRSGSEEESLLFVQQFGAVTYSVLFLLQSDSLEDLKMDLHSEELAEEWGKLNDVFKSLPEMELVLRSCCIDLLSGMSYPNAEVMELFLESKSKEFVLENLKTIMKDLNEGDVPTLEEWMILNHSRDVIYLIHTDSSKMFLSRLSKFRKGQMLEKVEEILRDTHLEEGFQGKVLSFIKLISDEFICETAILGIELLGQLKSPYLELDVSRFVCNNLSHIFTRKLGLTHKDREIIQTFLESHAVAVRFPRLAMLARAVLGENENASLTSFSHDVSGKLNKNIVGMIGQWCSEEVNTIEGLALAKMLGSLKYTQIMNIFSMPKFNLKVLQYCFVYLRNLYLLDMISGEEVTGLFSSELRTSLMEKSALGVACVEFVVDTLDTWENIASDELITEKHDWDFLTQLPQMWECLTAMLQLKKAVINDVVPDEKGSGNNFIPTKIFTISFQYILISNGAGKCIPVQQLRNFLHFASAAFSDPSFVSFFNVRDSPHHIFICAQSLHLLVEQLIKLFSIDWNYNQHNSDYYSEIDSECSKVLIDFDYLMDFVFQVRFGRIRLDDSIFEPLRSVISGLGRCELINGWILISHLKWKPQASWKSQIFPPIEPIPLEILRSDHELLLQYIFKLNIFGVASKVQFEENWVIFLSVINLYVDENFQLQIVSAGLKALSMLLQQCVMIEYVDKPNDEQLNRLVMKIDEIMDDVEPSLCKQIKFPPILTTALKTVKNQQGVDVNSCIRFLTDLYTQWLQNPQGKMPLLLLSEVVRSIVVLSEYFEENSQFQWMFETLMEIYKSFERDDEIIWPHLLYGIFYSGAKIELENEQPPFLAQMLETAIQSSYTNVSTTGLKCGLAFLQSHPDNLGILAVLVPYVLRFTQLDETTKDAESHSFEVWKLLLFIWIHGAQDGFGVPDFEQETMRNILTILSPLNKTYISIRLLVLKALRKKTLSSDLKPDVRKKITKVAYEALTTPNISIFTEALKLYATIFYVDFHKFRTQTDPDPEVLMPMAERTEVLFQLLKSGNKCNNQIVSKVLSLFILDFLPPSEILNRVIAEFMAPNQTAPELLAPVLAQVFEKARRKPKEAALVREWILAGLPNFMNNTDLSRTMWSLTLFFIGVSTAPEVATLLPFACLRRRTPQIQQLFLHSTMDLYGTLDESRRTDFRNTLLKNIDAGNDSSPFSYLRDMLNKADEQKKNWEIDSCSSTP